jgi:hypothetical protein
MDILHSPSRLTETVLSGVLGRRQLRRGGETSASDTTIIPPYLLSASSSDHMDGEGRGVIR